MILSAGTGVRFNDGLPKQYHKLMNKEVIAYSVEAMRASAMSEEIVIIAGEESVKRLEKEYSVACVTGGKTRNASIKIGLDYIHSRHPACERVFINEAVRPFLTAELVDRYYAYLDEYDAVITAQHITDSLGREGEAVTDRSRYYLIQAPEAFRFAPLYAHFSAHSPITATAQQLPAGCKVMKYFEYKHNMKITYSEDLLYAEQIMKLYR